MRSTTKTLTWQATSGIGSQASAYLGVSELRGRTGGGRTGGGNAVGGAVIRLRDRGGLLLAPNHVQDQGTSGSFLTIMESMVVAEKPAAPNFQNQAMKRHAGVMDPFPWRPPV
ncbi:MAG: hypothetical protein ABIS86_17315 [Streptosporangiaceae bacterium]